MAIIQIEIDDVVMEALQKFTEEVEFPTIEDAIVEALADYFGLIQEGK